MISDEEVKQFLMDNLRLLFEKNIQVKGVRLPTQVFFGKSVFDWDGQHPGACERHMAIFETFNVIPEYCFGCFKVFVKPRTVIEQIKLLLIFEQEKFLHENTRKCFVECREDIEGTYGGLVYSTNIDEATEIANALSEVVSTRIAPEIPVGVKRGCSEYGVAYPDYAKVDNRTTMMEYNNDWASYEQAIDEKFVPDPRSKDYEKEYSNDFALFKAKSLYCWLSYATTIGDNSYQDITNAPVPPLNMNRDISKNK